MNNEILTVGHMPPPVTGENICRKYFEEVLEKEGYKVVRLGRKIGKSILFSTADRVILVNRQSLLGTLSDSFLLFWFIFRRKKVWMYFHNRSWQRFQKASLPLVFRKWVGENLTMIVLTNQIAESLKQKGYNTVVINNTAGQLFDNFARNHISCRQRRLVWMGRPDESKGFSFALDVFRILASSDASWHFDVYGSAGENLPKLSNLHYHGFVRGSDKLRAFSGGGILILPSNYKNETQPLSIIEALGAGLPVVSSTAGAIAEMLDAGDHPAGVAVSERVPALYVAAVNDCLESYEKYSQSAKRIYSERYSSKVFENCVREVVIGKMASGYKS